MSSLIERKQRNGERWYCLQYYAPNPRDPKKKRKKVFALGIRVLGRKEKELAELQQKDFDLQIARTKAGFEEPCFWIADAIKQYQTLKVNIVSPATIKRIRQQHETWRKYFEQMGLTLVEQINDQIVKGFIDWRRPTAAPKTIKEELRILKSTLANLVSPQGLRASPVYSWPELKTPISNPTTVGDYSKSEVIRILRYLKQHKIKVYAPVKFMAYTGTRRGEAASVKVGDVDLKNRRVRINNHKTVRSSNDQHRFVPLSKKIIQLMKNQMRGRLTGDFVFPEIAKNQNAWITKAIWKACKDLGITYKRGHGFRQFFATRLLDLGVPPAKVQKWLGHASIATTMVYAHVNDEDRRYADEI